MKLEARDLSFRYDKNARQIFEHFSLSVTEQERVGIVARSGFGKTTLCKMLSGYMEPDEGAVLLDGKKITSYKGYCPVQLIWQQPELSVNPKMKMGDVILEGDKVESRIVEALGIEPDWMRRFPGELSGGELQRFCIARALGKGTRFLIADEISTMLDLITQSQIWNFLIEEVKRRQIGLVAVSHDQALLHKVCTRVIDLEQC